ncbi:Type IV secretion system protein VirB8 [Rickettsiales endosymbiont of Paramecium tredecaurelia]|uniref:VirB8/TrbF family protein n=1 Tax=Candidatus Sarmatiella mevalonica TaxID=2770581 RepID=UPI0019210842|nr:VirB8/TrbF family protein [Candidatus Sarmatiella mevalonica]MBL3284232.1 Type IV secretion system protein VirB8 [Candidatus Sarmatiella mevalonica]
MQNDIQGYIKNSLDWYQSKYLLVVKERVCMYLLACVCCVMTLIIALNLYSAFPLTRKVRAMIVTQDVLRLKSDKTHITDSDPDIGVAQFLVTNYLLMRESYDQKNIETQQVFVQKQSSKSVFNKFLQFMSINNPASPIIKYVNNTRSVEVVDVDVIDDERINVIFRALLKDKNNRVLEDITAQAQITFNMNELEKKIYNRNKFLFVVEDYQTKVISNNLQQKR